MLSRSFYEKYTVNWDALLAWERKFYESRNRDHEEWLFRGMACSSWELESSLERTCRTQSKQDLTRAAILEYVLYREFRRRYQNYRVGISDPVGIEWLSLMQHYGAPTRLLDFTYSFFIAAYFAMEKPCGKSCPHAIWAIRSKWVREEGIKVLDDGKKDVHYLENEQNECQWELQLPFFESLFNLQELNPQKRSSLNKDNPLCVFPINAMKLNERSTIQHGVFLCPGNVTKPFRENLVNLEGFRERKNLIKFVIPHKLRLEVLQRLHAMNINRAALFPGLEGFAASLGIYHPLAFDQPEQ